MTNSDEKTRQWRGNDDDDDDDDDRGGGNDKRYTIVSIVWIPNISKKTDCFFFFI